MRRFVTATCATGALLLGGLVAPADAGDPDLGRVWARDKILKQGCHDYRYQYRVRPGTRHWSMETFLRDPSGEIIASDAFDNATNKRRGSSTFRFCRWNTSPGKFKIRGKLTMYDGYDQDKGWVKPGYFRMRLRS
jgi:hypothetical protein